MEKCTMNLSTSRRRLIKLAALVGLSAFIRPVTWAATRLDLVKEPPPEFSLESRLTPVLKGRKARHEQVTLDMPEVAEDGSVVPVHILVESPMTAQDHVNRLTLLVDHNPDPLIFTATVSPALGRLEWWTKIRMAKSSKVRVFAETNSGALFTDEREVVVTLSGCG